MRRERKDGRDTQHVCMAIECICVFATRSQRCLPSLGALVSAGSQYHVAYVYREVDEYTLSLYRLGLVLR